MKATADGGARLTRQELRTMARAAADAAQFQQVLLDSDYTLGPDSPRATAAYLRKKAATARAKAAYEEMRGRILRLSN